MEFLKKNWFKIFSALILVFLCVYVPIVAIKSALDYEIYKEPEIKTKIYTIWHIETFEGGSKARIDYIKSIAREIEKQNAGVLFMIKAIEPEILADEINSSVPDMISFGFGVGKIVLSNLLPFERSFDIRDELVASGSFNNKFYAIPYIVSGYALITHGVLTNNFHCGQEGYTNPENIFKNLNLSPAEIESGYEAYKDFVYDKTTTLLGTGRDVFRVNNLNSIGRTNASITPIDSYTDLIQYFGITKTDEIIEKFVDYLMDDSRQRDLTNYSLFTSKNFKIYGEGLYSEMEDALLSCEVKNVFD